jgi:hypothetical protein
MAKPVGGDGGRRGGAVPSGDSPKPHGDKFASAGRPAAAGAGRHEADRAAVPSGDSPKPHGDKFASAARRSAAPGEGGSESDQGDD